MKNKITHHKINYAATNKVRNTDEIRKNKEVKQKITPENGKNPHRSLLPREKTPKNRKNRQKWNHKPTNHSKKINQQQWSHQNKIWTQTQSPK